MSTPTPALSEHYPMQLSTTSNRDTLRHPT